MNLLKAVSLSLALGLTACASNSTYLKVIMIGESEAPQYSSVIEPAVDTVSVVAPGEPLVRKYTMKTSEGIELKEDLRIEGVNNGNHCIYEVKAGNYYYVGDSVRGRIYSAENGLRQTVMKTGLDRTVDGGVYLSKLPGGDAGLFSGRSNIVEPMHRQVNAVPVTITEVDPESVQRQIAYAGRSGNVIHLEYREFKEEAALPMVTQMLTFDVSEEKVVRYKEASFDILEATNTGLKYRVITHLN